MKKRPLRIISTQTFLFAVFVFTVGFVPFVHIPVFAGLGGGEVFGDIPGGSSLWPQGIVHVLISDCFTDGEKDNIRQGLYTWRDQTNYAVQFVEISPDALPDRYVHILTPEEAPADIGATGCGSWGPQTEGPTYIWLQQVVPPAPIGCPDDLPSILHESGHSIGLGHEHLRPDRDLYMEFENPWTRINDNEIEPEIWPPDPKEIQDAPVGFFDYYSIMHQYPVLEHSDPFSPDITWPPYFYPNVLSDGDIDTVRALYAFNIYFNTKIDGGDYAHFPMDIDPTYGVPTQRRCQLACTADVRCKAYTYAGIGVLDNDDYPLNIIQPYCFLKDDASISLMEGPGMHSGVRKPDQKCSFGVAFDVDLFGGQISSGVVSMPHNMLNGKNCKDLCLEDTECDAFTFVPGSDSGTCYKKTHNPTPPELPFKYQPQDGYMSGVVRRANDVPATSDTGGPYTQEWTGDTTSVALNGTGSSDPEGSSLTYSWTTDCPGGTFNDPTSSQPILTLSTSSCFTRCNVSLVVTDDECLPSSSDSTTVTIQDTTPPVIMCNTPATGTITPTDAPVSFMATATDNCSTVSVEITSFNCLGKKSKLESCVAGYEGDTITISDSGGVGDTITWTVSATDTSGNSSNQLCSAKVVKPGRK